MTENAYFLDITQHFIAHYFEMLSTDESKVNLMYSDSCQLFNDKEKICGKEEVVKKIQSLHLTRDNSDKFIGQPYGKQNGIIINASASSNSKKVSITFILDEINTMKHQFAISFQEIYYVQ